VFVRTVKLFLTLTNDIQSNTLTLKTLVIPGDDDRFSLCLKRVLESAGSASSVEFAMSSGNVAEDMAGGFEALVLGPGAESACDMAAGDNDIRFVQFTGCRQSSLAAATLLSTGLAVANTGPALAPFVADHTMSLLHQAMVIAKQPSNELSVLTVGIVGLGNVGIEVARRLREAGASIIYHDVRTAAQGYANEVGARRHSFDRLLLNSDVVTLHVSDTPHTIGLIGERELKLMKSGAVLVNTSLAEVLDEDVVLSALESGTLGAAAFGVRGVNPGPLFGHERAITDIKDASESDAALEAVAAQVIGNLARVESGEVPSGLMDPVGLPAVGDPAFWTSRLAPRRPA
jgi:phosphoglycerate dehydrogenase-like enzyme